MKIAAVVILYHPDKDAISNIKTYYDCVDRIFVFDNSEIESGIRPKLASLPKVQFIQDFENRGIAERLNNGCRMAISENFDWILTMDQDSRFDPEVLTAYFNCFREYKGREQVAMFGTGFSRRKEKGSPGCTAIQADKLITSGSLLNLSLFTQVGEFDEQLFIDAVDYDYCFRAQMAGLAVVRFPDIFLLHTVGNEVYRASIKTAFLVKKKKEVHSPLRCYYMYRNMLYLQQKYQGKDKIYAKQIRGYVLSRISVSLLYGRNATKILYYLRRAAKDFKNQRMGKIHEQ